LRESLGISERPGAGAVPFWGQGGRALGGAPYSFAVMVATGGISGSENGMGTMKGRCDHRGQYSLFLVVLIGAILNGGVYSWGLSCGSQQSTRAYVPGFSSFERGRAPRFFRTFFSPPAGIRGFPITLPGRFQRLLANPPPTPYSIPHAKAWVSGRVPASELDPHPRGGVPRLARVPLTPKKSPCVNIMGSTAKPQKIAVHVFSTSTNTLHWMYNLVAGLASSYKVSHIDVHVGWFS